jgi:diguanylate cyclase (GGDEF)-like protein
LDFSTASLGELSASVNYGNIIMIAPLPENESERLKVLNEYAILDTLPEQAYDDIVRCASIICDTPIALITLVDDVRQWFKAKVGLETPETLREHAFCAHAIINPNEVMVVTDAEKDERFATNPLVTGDPNIRFYAGAPLVTPTGEALGTICVIDRVSRQLEPKQIEALQALSRQVVAQLELRHGIINLEQIILEREQQTRQLETALTQLEIQSSTDGLTGAKNRRAFQDQLEIEYNRARRYDTPFSLLLLDLDKFKEYNDKFGHPAGDDVLRKVVMVLRENSRIHDFVARYGGEEFAVILPNTPREGALVMGERFRRSIQQASWTLRPITASVGVATLTPDMTQSETLVLQADKSLYYAKQNGRNQVSYLQDKND